MRFKIGDKVKLIRLTGCTHGFTIGENCEITQIDNTGVYRIQIDNGSCHGYVDEKDIKKVQFTKSDLKNGDIVTYRYGDRRTLIKDTFECNDFGKSTSVLEHYNEDLTMKNGNKGMDIIKVERPVKYETVFERKKEILDEAEKRYLRDVIRPWRDKVDYIQKWRYSTGTEVIKIKTHSGTMAFPDLEKNMYKGMEANRKYTLEELGL